MCIDEWTKIYGVDISRFSYLARSQLDTQLFCAYLLDADYIKMPKNRLTSYFMDATELQELIDYLDGICWTVTYFPEDIRMDFATDKLYEVIRSVYTRNGVGVSSE